MKAYRRINFNICFILYVFKLVNGMVLSERSTTHLDHLLQKSLRCQHHKENYIQSIQGIIPNGLQLNKKPAFEPVSSDFNDKRRTTLYQAEKNLVQLLLLESDKVIAKINVGIESILKEIIKLNFGRNMRT